MSLSEELKRQAPQRNRQRGHGRQAFIARRNEIAQALADGYTAKDIWEFLHDQGTMPIQYRTFVDYVNRYILATEQQQKKPSPATPKQEETTREKEEKSDKEESKKKTDGLAKRFDHDPKPKSEKDLI